MSRAMPLSELLPDVALPRDVMIRGLVMDSRHIRLGDAFVAIAGFGTHGLAFVEQAREKGASAILFDASAPSAEYPAPADAIGVPGLRARMGRMADQFHGEPSAAMMLKGGKAPSEASRISFQSLAKLVLAVRASRAHSRAVFFIRVLLVRVGRLLFVIWPVVSGAAQGCCAPEEGRMVAKGGRPLKRCRGLILHCTVRPADPAGVQ